MWPGDLCMQRISLSGKSNSDSHVWNTSSGTQLALWCLCLTTVTAAIITGMSGHCNYPVISYFSLRVTNSFDLRDVDPFCSNLVKYGLFHPLNVCIKPHLIRTNCARRDTLFMDSTFWDSHHPLRGFCELNECTFSGFLPFTAKAMRSFSESSSEMSQNIINMKESYKDFGFGFQPFFEMMGFVPVEPNWF